MFNKLMARFVRYIRQYYVDLDFEYWLNSQGKFIGRNGKPVTIDTALLDCVNNCIKHGIHRASDHTSKIRKMLKSRETSSILIKEDGITYTLTIKFIKVD